MDLVLQLIVNGIVCGATYALVAVGYALVYGTLRFPNFAHGTIGMVGAYFCYWLAVKPLNLPFMLAAFLATLCSAFVGILVNWIAYRPFVRMGKTASRLAPLVTSIAAALGLQAIIMFASSSLPVNLQFSLERGLEIGSIMITRVQIYVLIATAILVVLLFLLLTYTRIGKAMRAVSDSVDLAEICGINTYRVIDFVFAMGSTCAALAGILFGIQTLVTHNLGNDMTVISFAAVILGGLGSVQGALFGGMALGLAENLGLLFLPAVWKHAISFAVMTIGLYIKPYGLYGKPGDPMVLGK